MFSSVNSLYRAGKGQLRALEGELYENVTSYRSQQQARASVFPLGLARPLVGENADWDALHRACSRRLGAMAASGRALIEPSPACGAPRLGCIFTFRILI